MHTLHREFAVETDKKPCPGILRRFWHPLHVGAVVALAFGGMAYSGIAADVKAGDSFPDLTAFKLEGKLPDSTKGKVVLVDFWASWCGPCKQSFPTMEGLHKRFAERGLVIIAVNEDEKSADMEEFLKKNTATFTVVRDANQKLVEKAGIATMPSSFLIAKDGKVKFVHTGYRGDETKKKYEEEIEELLK
jgi:thiol-disulfide isomerase/thioredoxin